MTIQINLTVINFIQTPNSNKRFSSNPPLLMLLKALKVASILIGVLGYLLSNITAKASFMGLLQLKNTAFHGLRPPYEFPTFATRWYM